MAKFFWKVRPTYTQKLQVFIQLTHSKSHIDVECSMQTTISASRNKIHRIRLRTLYMYIISFITNTVICISNESNWRNKATFKLTHSKPLQPTAAWIKKNSLIEYEPDLNHIIFKMLGTTLRKPHAMNFVCTGRRANAASYNLHALS